MTLAQAYKKKRYETGDGMNDAVDGVTATAKPGLMQGFGLAASIGTGIIDATAKPDPISGRISTGATVGKGALSGAATGAQFGPLGALAGGVLGAGFGLLKAGKEKKEARQMVAENARNEYMNDQSKSGALLATNPSLLTGFKNSGYFAMGGDMGGGGDPEPPKTRKLTPAEMAQWNQFLDHVKSKGYEGSADLNVKNKNLGASLFADWKKGNPNATINYDIVPSVQQEMQNLKTSAQGFAQRRGQANADQIMAGVSPVDGWFGSKTSQFRFPGLTTETYSNGQLVDKRNLGLVNADIKPVGINPDGTANNGQTNVAGSINPFTQGKPAQMQWRPGLNDIYGKPVPKDAKIELTADGKYFYDNPQEGLREVKFATGGKMKAPLSQMYMSGGYAKSLSSDNTEMVGNSHANGGISIPGAGAELEGNETTAGQFVFSDKLGFADIHKKIAKAKGKIEKKPPTFERVNSMNRLNAREQQLALTQEYLKQQHGIA